MQHHVHPQLPHRSEISYKEVLLRQCGSNHQGGKSVLLTEKPSGQFLGLIVMSH
jgi:hypothetical protein